MILLVSVVKVISYLRMKKENDYPEFLVKDISYIRMKKENDFSGFFCETYFLLSNEERKGFSWVLQ